MLASCRPLVRQSAPLLKIRPVLISRAMATSGAPKREWLVLIPDRPGTLQQRNDIREAHLKGITPRVNSGFIVLGGATLDEPIEEGKPAKMNGSALIGVADTKEELMEVLRNDVYVSSGVWDIEKAQVFPYRSAFRTGL